LFSSSNIIRVKESRFMRWRGHAECMGEMRNELVTKPEGNRPLGRPTRRWECNNIKIGEFDASDSG